MLKRRWVVAALAGLMLAGVAGTAGAQENQNQPLPAGETAPDFTLKAVDGKDFKLSEMTKKGPVLVNFFFNG